MTKLRQHAPIALLVLLVLYFVAAPISADFPWARYLVDGVYAVMLLAALNAGAPRITLRNPLVLAIGVSMILRFIALRVDTGNMWAAVEIYSSALMFYVAWVLLRNVMRDRKVSGNTIASASSVYILLAIAFASAHHANALVGENEYANVDISVPHRDQTFQFYYYSVVTQTTLGYGDITPVDARARGLTMAQVVMGQLYLAILLARLVAMELAQRRAGDSE